MQDKIERFKEKFTQNQHSTQRDLVWSIFLTTLPLATMFVWGLGILSPLLVTALGPSIAVLLTVFILGLSSIIIPLLAFTAPTFIRTILDVFIESEDPKKLEEKIILPFLEHFKENLKQSHKQGNLSWKTAAWAIFGTLISCIILSVLAVSSFIFLGSGALLGLGALILVCLVAGAAVGIIGGLGNVLFETLIERNSTPSLEGKELSSPSFENMNVINDASSSNSSVVFHKIKFNDNFNLIQGDDTEETKRKSTNNLCNIL